eukprot:6428799-Prymnesium_polylepis.2
MKTRCRGSVCAGRETCVQYVPLQAQCRGWGEDEGGVGGRAEPCAPFDSSRTPLRPSRPSSASPAILAR